MYLFDTITSAKDVAEQNAMYGLGLTNDQLQEASKLEIHCSSFDDPGDDYNVYRFIREDGTTLTEIRKEGY